MGTAIFSEWLTAPAAEAAARNGISIGKEFASWEEIARASQDVAAALKPYTTYVVDPSARLDAFVALLAVARIPGAALIWSIPDQLPFDSDPVAKGLLRARPDPLARRGTDRPLYVTLTSGSSGDAKLPVGFADQIALAGIHYDDVIYRTFLGDAAEGGAIATTLPLEYSATFMMAIMPAWFTARNLIIANPDRWDLLLDAARRRDVVAVTVPALLPLLCAAAQPRDDGGGMSILTTAGYLTRSRIASVQSRLPKMRVMSSYGASETGIMTLDTSPDGQLHVGRPLFGKPVWLSAVGDNQVGKVTTCGPDCREFYLGGAPIRNADGTVAATDLGHFDESGNLFLDGRIDAGEKLRGVTVYPRRIERHLLELPAVEDAKVRIVNGEQVAPDLLIATVVGDVAEAELREHCAAMPEFLRPHRYLIMAAEAAYSARGKL